jgi:CheY-like chemotaxis protein
MVAKTVLVVEDDPCLRIVAEEMFAAGGIEVESVQRADHRLLSSHNAPNKRRCFSPMSRLPARLTGSILQGW